jgi:hypothetical protein
LPDGTVRCPMCQRYVRVSTPMMIVVGVLGVCLLFGLLAWSSRFKSRVQNWQMSPEIVLQATQKLVAKNPGVRNPVSFSAPEQTTVEHWDAYRWRVSGFVDTQPESGSRVRTLYFAVVQNSGNNWRLEDLQLQNIESR